MTDREDLEIFERRLYRIDPKGIAMLRFLVEGYDGILFLRSLDPRLAVVELSWSKSCTIDAEEILTALCEELQMVKTTDL